jgi:hypothetical protein
MQWKYTASGMDIDLSPFDIFELIRHTAMLLGLGKVYTKAVNQNLL